jgi:hypothetical protein
MGIDETVGKPDSFFSECDGTTFGFKQQRIAMDQNQYVKIVGVNLHRIQKTSFFVSMIAGGLLFVPLTYRHTWIHATIIIGFGLSLLVGATCSVVAYLRFTRAKEFVPADGENARHPGKMRRAKKPPSRS